MSLDPIFELGCDVEGCEVKENFQSNEQAFDAGWRFTWVEGQFSGHIQVSKAVCPEHAKALLTFKRDWRQDATHSPEPTI